MTRDDDGKVHGTAAKRFWRAAYLAALAEVVRMNPTWTPNRLAADAAAIADSAVTEAEKAGVLA